MDYTPPPKRVEDLASTCRALRWRLRSDLHRRALACIGDFGTHRLCCSLHICAFRSHKVVSSSTRPNHALHQTASPFRSYLFPLSPFVSAVAELSTLGACTLFGLVARLVWAIEAHILWVDSCVHVVFPVPHDFLLSVRLRADPKSFVVFAHKHLTSHSSEPGMSAAVELVASAMPGR